jgi:hypothetical protein
MCEVTDVADDWITQSEAAELRGVSVSAISQLIRRGRLGTEERYGKLLVSRADVLAFEPSPGGWPKGRPRGAKGAKAQNEGQAREENKAARKRVKKKDPTRLLKTLS